MNNQFLLMHRQLENILVNRYAKITDSDSSEVSLEEFAREIRNPSAEIEALIREIRSCYKSHGGGKAGKRRLCRWLRRNSVPAAKAAPLGLSSWHKYSPRGVP